MRVAIACIIVLFAIAPSQANQEALVGSGESGTLVILAKSSSFVLVSVDSKISGTEPPSASTVVASERKLVAVGNYSACAINGYLGYLPENLDVATALREWVHLHPNEEAPQALEGLLESAAKTWNEQNKHPGHLAGGRKPGNGITTLNCGAFVNGHPVLITGETYVAEDSSAKFDDYPRSIATSAYISGVLQGIDLDAVLASGVPPTIDSTKSKRLAGLALVDPEVKQGLDIIKSVNHDLWTANITRNFAVHLFKVIEDNVPSDVASPNQAYVVSACGRIKTEVEEMDWPLQCGLPQPKVRKAGGLTHK